MSADKTKVSDADVLAIIKSADKNGDGRIDYEEFLAEWNSSHTAAAAGAGAAAAASASAGGAAVAESKR